MWLFKRKKKPVPTFDGSVAVRFDQGGLFAPGDVVRGDILWTKPRPAPLKYVTAHMYGFIEAMIFERQRPVANSQVKKVFTCHRSSEPVPAGETKFSFSLTGLPFHAPNSFVWNERGIKVEYTVTFRFYLHGASEPYCFTAPFLTCKPLPDLRPVGPVGTKVPNLMKYPNNKLEISFRPFSPMVLAGSVLPFDITFHNRSFKDIFSITITLIQIATVGRNKQKRELTATLYHEPPIFPIPGLVRGVDSSSSAVSSVTHTFRFQIPQPPPELPSTFQFHKLIDISYKLDFSILVGKTPWRIPWKIIIRQHDDATLRHQFANNSPHQRLRSESSPPVPSPSADALSHPHSGTIEPHRQAPPPPFASQPSAPAGMYAGPYPGAPRPGEPPFYHPQGPPPSYIYQHCYGGAPGAPYGYPPGPPPPHGAYASAPPAALYPSDQYRPLMPVPDPGWLPPPPEDAAGTPYSSGAIPGPSAELGPVPLELKTGEAEAAPPPRRTRPAGSPDEPFSQPSSPYPPSDHSLYDRSPAGAFHASDHPYEPPAKSPYQQPIHHYEPPSPSPYDGSPYPGTAATPPPPYEHLAPPTNPYETSKPYAPSAPANPYEQYSSSTPDRATDPNPSQKPFSYPAAMNYNAPAPTAPPMESY
jgi:hypothetical protein